MASYQTEDIDIGSWNGYVNIGEPSSTRTPAPKKSLLTSILVILCFVVLITIVYFFISSNNSSTEAVAVIASLESAALFEVDAVVDILGITGLNRRLFNRSYVSGSQITLDETAGTIEVESGSYLLTARSIAMFKDQDNPTLPTDSGLPTYLEIRDDTGAIVGTGTTQLTSEGVASSLTSVLDVGLSGLKLSVEHVLEAGFDPDNLWLGLHEFNSPDGDQNIYSTLSLVDLGNVSIGQQGSYALYSFRSDEPVALGEAMWDPIAFNTIDTQVGDTSTLDERSGNITLKKGYSYWISGFSTVLWQDFDNASAVWDPEYPPKGYCVLYHSDEYVRDINSTTCSWASVAYAVPSTFNSVLTIPLAESDDEEPFVQLHVAHQVAGDRSNMWVNPGLDTVSSRISIFALPSVAENTVSIAELSFYADLDLMLQSGWNTRYFNSNAFYGLADQSMQLNTENDTLTLSEGRYWAHGFSLVTWSNRDDKADVPEGFPLGQCQLSYQTHSGNWDVLSIGTTTHTYFEVPSEFEAFLEVESGEELRIGLRHMVLEHEMEEERLWLASNGGNSTNHVFARMTVIKL